MKLFFLQRGLEIPRSLTANKHFISNFILFSKYLSQELYCLSTVYEVEGVEGDCSKADPDLNFHIFIFYSNLIQMDDLY